MARFCIQVLCFILLSSRAYSGVCIEVDCTDNRTVAEKRLCLIEEAKAHVGVRELTGNNDGEDVEKFLATVGLGKGYAWCVAFLAYLYDHCDIPSPKSAWSPHWGLKKDMIWQQGMPVHKALAVARMADIFTKYYNSKNRIGHGEIIYYMTPAKIVCIGGNTNDAGSREGDGVYVKHRKWSEVYRITSYL